MLTTEKPIFVFDDTGRDKEKYELSVIFENDDVIVGTFQMNGVKETAMINKKSEAMYSENTRFFLAEN